MAIYRSSYTLRERFACYLEDELAARGLKPADMLRREWTPETKHAVAAAMNHSPVLFSTDAVAKWCGVSEDIVQRVRAWSLQNNTYATQSC